MLPSSISKIPNYTFRNCSALVSITIPSSVTYIGSYAFRDCSSLMDITIPGSVSTWGTSAFEGCSNLSGIVFEDGTTSIDFSRFFCANLANITIPGSVTTISNYVSIPLSATITIPICNSSAHTWARTNGFNVAVTEHQEVMTDEAVAANCTETGLTEGSHCEVCGETLVAQEIVAALGHTTVIDPAVAPTDTLPGLTEGSHCDVCGEVLTAQQRVHPLVWETEGSDTGVTILKHYVTAANCSIPAMINGESVTSIAANAFTGSGCPANVYIPASVNSISLTAFSAPATVYCHMYSEADYWVDDVGYGRVYVDDTAHGTFYLIAMPDDFRMEVGTAQELGATVWPLTGEETVTIASSDPGVVAVSGETLTALSIGSAEITLQVGGMSTSVTVTTYANPTDYSIGDEATRSTDLVIITRTDRQVSAFGIEPRGADVFLNWESDNTGVATVESNGDRSAVVSAKRPGTATITATSQNGIVRTCTVTVCIPVTAVSFDQTEVTIGNGCAKKLTVTATAGSAFHDSSLVVFTSSDESIATVGADGVVHGVDLGTVTITATAVNDDSITAACTVTVAEPTIFNLPASLTIIESEAFAGLPNVDAIRIPAHVTSIAPNAFDPGTTLIVPVGSAWVQWAEDNGYGVIEE